MVRASSVGGHPIGNSAWTINVSQGGLSPGSNSMPRRCLHGQPSCLRMSWVLYSDRLRAMANRRVHPRTRPATAKDAGEGSPKQVGSDLERHRASLSATQSFVFPTKFRSPKLPRRFRGLGWRKSVHKTAESEVWRTLAPCECRILCSAIRRSG